MVTVAFIATVCLLALIFYLYDRKKRKNRPSVTINKESHELLYRRSPVGRVLQWTK